MDLDCAEQKMRARSIRQKRGFMILVENLKICGAYEEGSEMEVDQPIKIALFSLWL